MPGVTIPPDFQAIDLLLQYLKKKKKKKKKKCLNNQ